MSTRTKDPDEDVVIEHTDQLGAYLATGNKPKSDWRAGTEHEKWVYHKDGLRPPSYAENSGIRDVLNALTPFGWEPVIENDNVIALKQGLASVSLEPGGQLELSGAPVETLHETCAETGKHLEQCAALGTVLGLGFLGTGFIPDKRRDEIPIMPKGRYKIMLNYMPKVGSLGLDMMLRTCTVQTNLDFSSEADMVKKFRVSLALQPIATALFANSPFTEGKPNGYLSYRSHIWTDTDKARTGMLPFVFEDGFGFDRYANYMCDVPMYFVYRNGQYIDVAGESWRAFMAGKLEGFEGQRPTLADWKDHLSTAFPEVRLKTFLEMRGADSGPWASICALPALFVGLLYDQTALDAGWDMVSDWTPEEHLAMRRDVPKLGLSAPFRGGTLLDVAKQTLAIADAGLKSRARLDAMGNSEQGYLNELHQMVERGQTRADRLLEAYHGRWGGDMTKLYAEESF